MIMAEKSYIECEQIGACKINMHFMRMQKTEDKFQDHQIDTELRATNFKANQ